MKKLVACLLSVATMVATLYTPAFAYEGQPLGRNELITERLMFLILSILMNTINQTF